MALSQDDATAWGQLLVESINARVDSGWNPFTAVVDAMYHWILAIMIFAQDYVEQG